MKTAAAYVRVSTDDQIEFSPDSQIKALKNYALKNKLYLPENFIFIDEGISGRSVGKRENFKKMIALAKTKPKPFDVILVWKYSRFARNREDSVVYKSMLRKQYGIDVVSISESIGDDKMSVLFEAMIEAMDEYYSINLAEEVKRGMTEKAKRGGVLSAAPFGYKVENGKFEIIEQEADIIRDVFQSYANGTGFLTIAKKLNSLGVRTHRNSKIENRTIEYWLNNSAYIGKTHWKPTGKMSRDYHNKDIIISDGKHQPIIDVELWNKVQGKLAENKKYYKARMREPRKGLSHWLVGILRCGKCGHVLANCGGYFYCGNKSKGLCDGNGCISAKNIERIVVNKLEEILDNESVKVEFSEPNKKEDIAEESETKIIRGKIVEARRKLERVKEAYEAGVDTLEEYKQKKDAISNDISKLEELLKQEKEVTPISNSDKCTDSLKCDLVKISDILKSNNLDNETKNRVAKSIIKEIIKTGDDGKTFRIIFWGK